METADMKPVAPSEALVPARASTQVGSRHFSAEPKSGTALDVLYGQPVREVPSSSASLQDVPPSAPSSKRIEEARSESRAGSVAEAARASALPAPAHVGPSRQGGHAARVTRDLAGLVRPEAETAQVRLPPSNRASVSPPDAPPQIAEKASAKDQETVSEVSRREQVLATVVGPADTATRRANVETEVTGASVTVAPLMPRLERPPASAARVSLSIGSIEIRTRTPVQASPTAPPTARAHQIDPGLGPGLLQLGRHP